MTQKHQEDQLKPTTDLLTTNRSDASPPSVATLWIGGSVLLWALYAVVIWVSYHPTSWLQSVVDALANVLPLTLLAFALRAILRGEVMARSPTVQAAWHVGLGITFATVWYGTVLILLAFSRGLLGDGFDVRAFAGPAFAWQVFQGLILYAAVAAICYAVQGGRDVAQVTIVTAEPSVSPLNRYLIRKGDSMTPVEVGEIISISGAQDYSEVTTLSGTHLVRLSLSEFQARLDPDQFIRVHRSTLINLGRLIRTEPAGGGRLLAHMEGGGTVQVSRAGTQELRRFMV